MNIDQIRAAAESECLQQDGGFPRVPDQPSYAVQNRIALRNCGRIDPRSIGQYIARGRGFTGLSRALCLTGDQSLTSIQTALRGRGGPGFSTAGKIREFHTAAGDKYVVCNAVDAAPGGGASNLLLESDPFSVVEGMLISACAAGASNCLMYVNAGRDLVKRLGGSLEQMKKYGLLGSGILDSDFSADIRIEEVPDSLISIHKSEILRYLDDVPIAHPAYPRMTRLTSCPSAVYNTETMAVLSGLLLDGIEKRPGTKIVTLSGSVMHKDTAEIAFGTSIRSIVETIGGIAEGKKIRAVQLGGPAGILIDSAGLDFQVGCTVSEESYSNLGSGEIEVFDTEMSAVEMAKSIAARIHDQSCGRCLLCFEASRQISDVAADINLLHELIEAMQTGCGCSFGRSAAENLRISLKF